MRQRAADTASRGPMGSGMAGAYMKNPSPTPSGVRLGSSGTLLLPSYFSGLLFRATFPGYFSGLLFRTLVGRADTRRAHEQLLAVREGDVAAVGARGAVLGLEALDEDLGAGQK